MFFGVSSGRFEFSRGVSLRITTTGVVGSPFSSEIIDFCVFGISLFNVGFGFIIAGGVITGFDAVITGSLVVVLGDTGSLFDGDTFVLNFNGRSALNNFELILLPGRWFAFGSGAAELFDDIRSKNFRRSSNDDISGADCVLFLKKNKNRILHLRIMFIFSIYCSEFASLVEVYDIDVTDDRRVSPPEDSR